MVAIDAACASGAGDGGGDDSFLFGQTFSMNLDELTRNCFQSGFSAPKVRRFHYLVLRTTNQYREVVSFVSQIHREESCPTLT